MFKAIYNSLGQLESIYTEHEGIQTPLDFDAKSKTFDEEHLLTIALREWEKENGKLDLSDRQADPQTLEQAKAFKKQEIIAIAAAKQEELVAGFAPPEQASWSRKVEDSKAFLQAGTIDKAGMLNAEAIAICQSQDEKIILKTTNALAIKILQKSQQLYDASASIAGTRTRLTTQIDAAKTFEQLNGILWN